MLNGRGDLSWCVGTQIRMKTTKSDPIMFREEKVIGDQLFPLRWDLSKNTIIFPEMRLLVEWVIIYMFFTEDYYTSPLYYASDKDLALNPLESTPPSMQVVWPSTFNVWAVISFTFSLVVVKSVNNVFSRGFLPEWQYQNFNGVFLTDCAKMFFSGSCPSGSIRSVTMEYS